MVLREHLRPLNYNSASDDWPWANEQKEIYCSSIYSEKGKMGKILISNNGNSYVNLVQWIHPIVYFAAN
jgi:hypothetical protein